MSIASQLRSLALLVAVWSLTMLTSGAMAAPVSTSTGAPSQASAIPFKQDHQTGNTPALQAIAGVVLAGLAAYGIVLGLKRSKLLGGRSRGTVRRLHAVESKRLGRRSTLHVVTYRDQELLLAENEQGLQVLSTHPLDTKAEADCD